MSPIVKQKYPIKLRGTAREEFKIFEATLLNLSPCVSIREYRGSARRARGLNVQYKQTDMMAFSTPPSLRTPPLSHIRAQRRSTTHFLAFIVFYATRQNILTSPCRAPQHGGVSHINIGGEKGTHPNLLLCVFATQKYRGGGTK